MTRLYEASPFIICEVGSNWRTLHDCLYSIDMAKECGADAVKFQAFDYESLYGLPGTHPHTLPIAWLPQLKAHADHCGIEFLCTAFSPELVAAVDPFVEIHKVASSDAAWPQLLDAIAATRKPALLSTGAKSDFEIDQALDRFPRDSVLLLLCISAYPASFVDLSDIPDEFDGFSDHTLGTFAALEAARRGAIVIEKHFTAFPEVDTPDCGHSLTPGDFKEMVQAIRDERWPDEEKAMYLRHNRRLIATRDIAIGDALIYGDNFGAYRSLVDDTKGLSPFDWEKAQGNKSYRSIKRGEAISLEDF